MFGAMLIVALVTHAPGAIESGDEPSILFVSNSLTFWNDMPAMLRWMLLEPGIEVGRIEFVACPNFGLEDRWRRGAARERIAEGGRDFVVMQQGHSATEGRPSLLKYAQRLARLIREIGATPEPYMVWPTPVMKFDFEGVADACTTAAAKADALLLPAGEAWRAAWRTDPDLRLYGKNGIQGISRPGSSPGTRQPRRRRFARAAPWRRTRRGCAPTTPHPEPHPGSHARTSRLTCRPM